MMSVPQPRSRHAFFAKASPSRRSNGAVALAVVAVCAFAQMANATNVHADDALDSIHGEGRLRLAPFIGGGVAGVVGHTAPFPHAIGLSELGVEIAYERVPWGVWARGSFLSAGDDGQWNTPSVAIGASLRVFGDGVRHASLVLRGGLAYEPWHAASNACSVYLFVPTSCRTFPAQDPDSPTGFAAGPKVTDDNAQMIGVLAGARLELPIRAAYVAFDSAFVPVVNVGGGDPVAAFSLRFALVFSFRDRRDNAGSRTQDIGAPDNRHRIR